MSHRLTDQLLSIELHSCQAHATVVVTSHCPHTAAALLTCTLMLAALHAGAAAGTPRSLEARCHGSRRPACARGSRIVAAAQPDDSQEVRFVAARASAPLGSLQILHAQANPSCLVALLQAQRPLPNKEPHFLPPADNRPPPLVGDWRTFRAQLVAQERAAAQGAAADPLAAYRPLWAHEIGAPEKGCLLVARREGLGMFHSAVILMLEHDDQQGSSGLVINYPTPLLISNLGLEEDIAESFGRSPLYVGGPVTKNLLHVLHGRRDVEGALEILDGVYAGGVESAAELVRRGEASPSEFRLLAGYSGWGPWQLRQELAAGTWWAVAASQQLILEVLTDSGGGRAGARRGEGAPALVVGAARPHAEVLKRRCWERVLQAAGIDYSIHKP